MGGAWLLYQKIKSLVLTKTPSIEPVTLQGFFSVFYLSYVVSRLLHKSIFYLVHTVPLDGGCEFPSSFKKKVINSKIDSMVSGKFIAEHNIVNNERGFDGQMPNFRKNGYKRITKPTSYKITLFLSSFWDQTEKKTYNNSGKWSYLPFNILTSVVEE